MQPAEAKELLPSLIEGRNPVSGECIPSERIVHHSDVLRTLPLGVGAIDAMGARTKRRAALRENVDHARSVQEDERLRSEFATLEPLGTIAATHGTTQCAIEAQVQRMGLIMAKERTTREGYAAGD